MPAPKPERKVCGAKTRAGHSCGRWAMANGRCDMHGGKTPPVNISTITHGAYSSVFTDEDKGFLDTTEIDQLDDELMILRVRLRRLTKIAQQFEDGQLTVDMHGPVEVVEEEGSGENGGFNKTRSVKRLPDYNTYIDRYIGRIAVLTRLRAELTGTLPTQGGDGTTTVIVKRGGLPTQAELDAEED